MRFVGSQVCYGPHRGLGLETPSVIWDKPCDAQQYKENYAFSLASICSKVDEIGKKLFWALFLAVKCCSSFCGGEKKYFPFQNV